uniref:Uncharacterized protein n=1 Tax=Anguilla anguilla TaxID=7936 RepID=A0A0E9XDU4_ANGAN
MHSTILGSTAPQFLVGLFQTQLKSSTGFGRLVVTLLQITIKNEVATLDLVIEQGCTTPLLQGRCTCWFLFQPI